MKTVRYYVHYWKDRDESEIDTLNEVRLDSWTLASSSSKTLKEAEELIDRCFLLHENEEKNGASDWRYKIVKKVVIETREELYLYTWE